MAGVAARAEFDWVMGFLRKGMEGFQAAVLRTRRAQPVPQRRAISASTSRATAPGHQEETGPTPRCRAAVGIGIDEKKSAGWVIVMASSASAEKRVASPISSSSGKRCSAKAAIGAASSGGMIGSLYSSRKRSTTESENCGQPNSKLPGDEVDGETLHLGLAGGPEGSGSAKRARKAISESGMRLSKSTTCG